MKDYYGIKEEFIEKIKGDSIVVFGTALHAVKCLYHLKNKNVFIKYFLNNNCLEKTFCGYSVYKPTKEKITGNFILVATSDRVYPEISRQLRESGLREFDDYIYYEWLYKKVALLHGNCHMATIRSFLMSSKQFFDNYSIYPNPPIYLNKEKRVSESGIKNCDVWIHQDIRKENAWGYYFSDEYLRQNMCPDVEEIVVPNLFGLGKFLFPQIGVGENLRDRKINNGTDVFSMFPWADSIIDKCMESGMNKKEIEEFCKGVPIEENEIRENFRYYIEKIRVREQAWDIKIVDFILDHYKDEKLFYDMYHPCDNIIKQISIGVLKKLGIDDENIFNSEDSFLDANEDPVYPVVKNVLGLRWEETFIRKSIVGKKICRDMDFSQYIEEYLFWCYEV